jgi:hypothetical protein
MVDSRWIRLCLWSGPVLVVMFAIAMVPLTGFIPPPSPDASAREIADLFRDDTDSIRIGLSIGIVAMALIAPFGIGVASMLRGSERGTPVLTYVQIACVAIGTSVAVIMCLVWGTASFRPDELAPDTTRMLNDLAWFFFLFSFAPFSVWLVAVGLAIISDERAVAPFPRWSAYLNFWLALLFVPAVLMIFFKHGAYSFNGLIAFWVPTLSFFGWVMAMTVLGLCALRRPSPGLARAAPGQPQQAAEPAPTAMT